MKAPFGFGKLGIFGQPYHGLWKGGVITLPNGATKACPAPANGGVVLIRHPGQAEVVRSPAEQAADAAAGFEWRNYALISGGYYGGVGPFYSNIPSAHVIFIDGAGVRWLMKLTTSSSYVNYMTVSIKRIAHIDGTVSSWSSEINVPIDARFVASVHSVAIPLITISQNTTGREFVLGCVVNGGYANGLLKVGVSGTVDLGASSFGLTFSNEVLEWQDRLNYESVGTESVSGTCVNVITRHHLQRANPSHVYTGVEYIEVQTYTDGVLDTNGPPVATGAYDWIDVSLEYSRSTSKTKTFAGGYRAKRAIWAAYVEDVLKVYTLEYSDISSGTLAASWWSTGADPSGYWIFSGMQERHKHLISRIGDQVVWDQHFSSSQYIEQQVSFGTYGLQFPPTSMAGYTVDNTSTLSYKASLEDIISSGSIDTTVGSVTTWTAKYLLPIKPNGQRWASPIMVLCTRTKTSTDPTNPTYVSHSVWAPSGINVATSTAIANLFATWHPVLNQLHVDTENVCWF